MENKKQVIAGFHDPMNLGPVYDALSKEKYQIHEAFRLEQMEELMEKNPNADIYLMDINLGKPNTAWAEPALKVYKKLENRLKNNECIFYAVSFNNGAIDKAEELGIPEKYIPDKLDLYKLLKKLD